MTITKNLEKQTVSFDQKRMDKSLKSRRVEVPKGLTREQKRAFILSHT